MGKQKLWYGRSNDHETPDAGLGDDSMHGIDRLWYLLDGNNASDIPLPHDCEIKDIREDEWIEGQINFKKVK